MSTITLGYTIFTVDDVAATAHFFTTAFDLPLRLLTPEHDYAEVDTGPTTLAFVSTELAHANLADAGGFVEIDPARPAPASITLLTNDVEATVGSAIDAGATMYVDTTEKPWGQTVAYLLGPSNILIEVATPVAA